MMNRVSIVRSTGKFSRKSCFTSLNDVHSFKFCWFLENPKGSSVWERLIYTYKSLLMTQMNLFLGMAELKGKG